MARSVNAHDGADIRHAGERTQSHDLEIPDSGFLRLPYLRQVGLSPGKYEVKSLWRKNDRSAFDRRFKAGQRGELIYGRRDAVIKSFAMALEREIDSVIEHSLDARQPATPGSVQRFVEEAHEFIDLAIGRRHSKAFMERLERLAKASLSIPAMLPHATAVLGAGVGGADIVKGFDDIEGIFVVAGPIYTLVTKAEMPQFLTFDSASAEGPKLRWAGVIPSEQDSERKEKGKRSK